MDVFDLTFPYFFSYNYWFCSFAKGMEISSFHTRRSLCVLDKEVKDKSSIVKMAMSEKQEAVIANDDDVDLSGLTEYVLHYSF